MAAWLDHTAWTLLDTAVGGALLSLVVVLLMIGTRQPARRCALARAGIVASLALPVLVAVTPVPRISLPHVCRPFAPPKVPGEDAEGDEIGPIVTRLVVQGPRIALGVYAAGFAVGLAWLGLGYGGLILVLRRSTGPSDAGRALYETLPYRGRGARPRLRVSTRVNRPVLVGLRRPTILIPPAMDLAGGEESLRLSLLHELVHAERGDSWFALWGALSQAAWFFLPSIWWVRMQMRLDQEFLADRHASRGFGTSRHYATSLVDLASGRTVVSPGTGRKAATPGMRGLGSALFVRVLMLIRCPFPMEGDAPLWWRCVTWSSIAALTFLLSGLTFRSADAGPSGPPLPNVFTASAVTLESAPPGPDGHGRSYTFPFRLPPTFDLSIQVFSAVDAFSETRISSIPLGTAGDLRDSSEGWHDVRLRRTHSGMTLWVDGIRAAHRLPNRPAPWLSVQGAPNQVTRFRDLSVRW